MFTDIEQQTLDIDWFFTNGDDIAFVASGGARLPLSVEKSKKNLELLSSYFNQLPESAKYKLMPILKK